MDNQPYDEAGQLRVWLEHHNAPCPACGYNLRRLTGDICPECGRRFRLQIGEVDPHFGYLLAFVAPMMALLGLGLILLIGFVVAVIDSGGLPRVGHEWGIYAFIAMGLVAGAATVRIYRRRRWFLAKAKTTQWALIVCSWLFLALVVVISMSGL